MGRFDPPSAHSTSPPNVDEVVLRALEREPERRYQRAAEVKSDLESLERGEQPAAAPPRPTRAASDPDEPKLSPLAIAAAACFAVGFLPFLFSGGTFMVANPGTTVTVGRQMGLAQLLMMIPGVFGLLSMGAGCILGFTALDRIRRSWPRLYGVVPAAVGAWGVILMFANAVILSMIGATANSVWFSAATMLPAALLLLVCDILFLAWYRRRFLRKCESAE